MKRSIKLILISLLVLIPINVKAASISVSMSCPSSAKAGSTVSCTISAAPSGANLKGIQAKYNISNGTYAGFSLGSGWTTSYSSSSKGFSIGRTSATSSKVTVGTLKVKMPNSGSATVSLTGVEGSSSSYVTLPGNSPSSTIRVKSTVNTLSALSLSNGTLSPSFSKSTTSYTTTIDSSSTTISASKTDSKSSISGAGKKSLEYGNNTFKITVTSEAGTKKTYTITINRPDKRSSVNDVASLSVSPGTLSPSFRASTTSYTVSVENTVKSISIKVAPKHPESDFISGYGSRTVNLDYGSNKVLVKVKAENGNIKTYTITVNRKDNRNSDTTLKELTLSEGTISFNSSVRDYNMTVPNEIEKIEVTATTTDTKSKITVTGGDKLKEGINKIVVKVTAENQTSKNYTITVIRQEKGAVILSNDSSLKSLKIGDNEIKLEKDKYNYMLQLPKEMDKIDVEALASDPKSSIEIKDNENIIDGSTITIVVTAEDDSATTYTINCSIKVDNTITYILIAVISVIVTEAINLVIFKTLFKKKSKKK